MGKRKRKKQTPPRSGAAANVSPAAVRHDYPTARAAAEDAAHASSAGADRRAAAATPAEPTGHQTAGAAEGVPADATAEIEDDDPVSLAVRNFNIPG